ncbi:phage protein [Niallia circulans]|uniref:Phage protein n=1 Tax=Niallia circulans TaxID=1397 RepID=A0A0J1III9_NIACI|nr:phage protein [Niallia circulans]KLV25712.1 phage protein [Niallia circulans]
MIVETRKTAAGTEYWDAKNKKSLFVAKGQEPSFEVTKNPKSMIATESIDEPVNIDGEMHLEDMTVKQLHAFAKQINVEIPSDIKKKEDIVAFLTSDSE